MVLLSTCPWEAISVPSHIYHPYRFYYYMPNHLATWLHLLAVIIKGLILGLCPANERRRYFVTTSLIGWAQAMNNQGAVERYPKCKFILPGQWPPYEWKHCSHQNVSWSTGQGHKKKNHTLQWCHMSILVSPIYDWQPNCLFNSLSKLA